MKIEGYKTYLSHPLQKVNGEPLIKGETTFQNNLSFSAQLFSDNGFPVKLQLELRPHDSDFDDNIQKGNPYLFESDYVSSGDIANINVSNLADNVYHWRMRVIDLFGFASRWYYYENQNSSDFYLDADQSDYPQNVLYALAPNLVSSFTTEFASTMYGPWVIFSIFLTSQSGYVEKIELPAYYFYCSFSVRASLYSVSPNQVDGHLDQLLATSLEGANSHTYKDNFGLLTWYFDKPVFLEAHRYYALKLDFSEVNTGTANCLVFYRSHPDITSSKIYLQTNDGWQVKTENDLDLVVYKLLEMPTAEKEKNQ